MVLSKTQNDDKLIAALRKELVAATGGKAGSGRYVGTAKGSTYQSISTVLSERARLYILRGIVELHLEHQVVTAC